MWCCVWCCVRGVACGVVCSVVCCVLCVVCCLLSVICCVLCVVCCVLSVVLCVVLCVWCCVCGVVLCGGVWCVVWWCVVCGVWWEGGGGEGEGKGGDCQQITGKEPGGNLPSGVGSTPQANHQQINGYPGTFGSLPMICWRRASDLSATRWQPPGGHPRNPVHQYQKPSSEPLLKRKEGHFIQNEVAMLMALRISR